MDQPPQLPSDGELLISASLGLPGAWTELVRRHGEALTAVAHAKKRLGAQQAVARTLDALHGKILETNTPDDDSAETLSSGVSGVRAVRPRMISLLEGGTYGPDVNIRDAELYAIAEAFATLPEPWQTALWHRAVELQPTAEFAPMLGRTATESAALVQHAEAGLFEVFLLAQRSHDDIDHGCHPVIPLLGGAFRSSLSSHEQRVVDEHLTPTTSREGGAVACEACARRVEVRQELVSLIPGAIVPALTGLSVDKYRAALSIRPSTAGSTGAGRRSKFAVAAGVGLLLVVLGAGAVLVQDSLGKPDASSTTGATEAATEAATGDSTELEKGNDTKLTTATTEPDSTTTTEVELRPAPTELKNRVSIIFPEIAAPVGFAPNQSVLGIELLSPGPIFAGGTGTIDIVATNNTDALIETSALLKVPKGVLFADLVAGDAECVDPDNNSASCAFLIPAASSTTLTVRFSLASSVVGSFVVGSDLAPDELEVPIFAVSRLLHSSVDNGQIIMLGNTLMTCSELVPACLDARDGVGDVLNRWDLPAEFIGSNPGLGWENSSAASFDIGNGSIEAAYLFWSGDLKERGVDIPDDGSKASVSLLGPGGDAAVEIEANQIRLGDVDATQYFGVAEVTDIVTSLGPGEYLVGNVQSVEVQGSYAGWSMVIITRDETLPRRSMTVTTPFSWFSPDDVYAANIAVPAGTGKLAHLDVLAFEGDRSFVPERLAIGGQVLGDDVFDSSIVGSRIPADDNNFGMDIDAYDLSIDAPEGNLPIKATSDKDGVRLAVLALAVDVK
jgi:hypothetical protein